MINNKENRSIIIGSLSLAFILGIVLAGIIQLFFQLTLLTITAAVVGAFWGGFKGAILGQKYSRDLQLKQYFNHSKQ